MVETIKKGTKRLVDCLDCGSTLKFEANDINREYVPPSYYDDDESYSYYIKCPECKEKVYVTSKMTSSLEKKVDKREKYLDEDL